MQVCVHLSMAIIMVLFVLTLLPSLSHMTRLYYQNKVLICGYVRMGCPRLVLSVNRQLCVHLSIVIIIMHEVVCFDSTCVTPSPH